MNKISKNYIEDNLGLKKEKDAGGGEVYFYENEGFFIKSQSGSNWMFIPIDERKRIVNEELFETLYR